MLLNSILFITQSGDTLPSVRFRVLPYIKNWQKKGLNVKRYRIPKTFLNRLIFYLKIPSSDIIILQKKLISPFELYLLKLKAKKICFDFDDAIWTNHPSVKITSKVKQKNKKNKRRLQYISKNIDLLICGNKFLEQNIAKYSSKSFVLPTPIDTTIYRPSDQFNCKKNTTVGWIGTNTNIYFIEKIISNIIKISDIDLKIISNIKNPNNLKGIIYEKWDSEKEIDQIKSFDIGLMPLIDDEYTQGKCGFKILQYMSCGVVPIASNIGFNKEIISHGYDGFLVDTDKDWEKYINTLKNNPEMRCKMAQRARKKIINNFDISISSRKLLNKLEDLFLHEK